MAHLFNLFSTPKIHPNRKPPLEVSKSNLDVLRVVLFISLIITAALGGYFSYALLLRQERRIEEVSFTSTTSQMQDVSVHSITAMIESLHSYRVFLKSNCPTLDSWPSCTVDIDDYNSFANGLNVSADINTCNHEALVRRSDVDSFVTNAANFYTSSGYNDVADIVRNGVFSVNETDVEPQNDFILPILQIVHPELNSGALMFNIYSGKDRIPLIDKIYACVRALHGTVQPSTFTTDEIGRQCMVMTKVINLIEDSTLRPGVVLMYPMMLPVVNLSSIPLDMLEDRIVIEVNGQSFVHVGSLSAISYLDLMFTKAVSEETNGLCIVLNDGSNDYYYTFQDGKAVFLQSRSPCDSRNLEVAFPFTTLPNSDFTYSLTIRGDDTFSSRYYSNNPIYACVISLGAIVFSIAIYRLYDLQTSKHWAQNARAKRNFVRYISHEIRTPLTTVSLGIKLVIKELLALRLMSHTSCPSPPHPPSLQLPQSRVSSPNASRSLSTSDEIVVMDNVSVLESVEGSLDSAVLILTDLLNYDKIRHGNLDITRECVNASKLMYDAGVSLKVAAHGVGVNLVVNNHIPHSVGTVPEQLVLLGDDIKLHQVLRNLISNALKFTYEQGLVTMSGAWDEEAVHPVKSVVVDKMAECSPCGTFVMTVQDDGVGVSAENLKAVFSDGWQFNANMLQHGQGSGLGLWITKRIVEMHHGTLSCHSGGLGKGCTMRLELPAFLRRNVSLSEGEEIPGVVANNTAVDEVRSFEETWHRGRGKRVLVVDDSALCRKMVIRLLRSMSYECVEASNGLDGAKKLSALNGVKPVKPMSNQQRIDFVLLDFEMPLMDGPTACKLMREQGYTLPIIGLTGNALQEDLDLFIKSGANDVIVKPFSLKDFVEVIQKC